MRILNIRGGTGFWQWDTGRKIVIIGDEEICGEAHFCTGSGDPFSVTIRTEAGQRMADVPDELLQEAKPFSVYLYRREGDGGATRYSQRFAVHPRTKPTDYVYTPSERQTWSQLLARIEALEGEGLAKAVADYLTEHPPEVGATAEQAQQIEQNKQNIENLTRDKLDADKLPEAVNEALTKAKESGEFDGKPGEPGPTGPQGEQGECGPAGPNGQDGITPRIGVNDNWWIGDIDTGKPSRGEPGPEGPRGEPGKDGKPGADGKTPVKGTDYFTPDEVQEIAEQAAQLVEVPEGGGGPSGGSAWRQIAKVTLREDAGSIEITKDSNGNPFELSEFAYVIEGKSLGASGNIGLKINNQLVYYTPSLSNTNTTAVLKSGGHGVLAGMWVVSYKSQFNAAFEFTGTVAVSSASVGKMTNFWYGCTNGAAGVGFQAGTTLELWGR